MTFTDPDPAVDPADAVMNAALLRALHVHAGAAVTAIVTTVAVSSTVNVDGARLVEQGCAGCVIVTVCPATMIVPVRGLSPAFAGTVTVTRPVPLPAADPIVRKLALLCAVQPQPAAAVTGIVSVPPAPSTVRLS